MIRRARRKALTNECVNMSVHTKFRNELKAIASSKGMTIQEYTKRVSGDAGKLENDLNTYKKRRGFSLDF